MLVRKGKERVSRGHEAGRGVKTGFFILFYFFINLFVFIFGCVGSSLLHVSFL